MRIDPPAAALPAVRLPLIDAARGIAVAAMVVYHFCWDLRYFGYIAADVEGALGWRIFSHATAGAFLFIVGVSLVLSTRRGFALGRFLRRLAVLVAASAAITLVTVYLFPDSYIFFGILHNIALSSVLGLAFLRPPVAIVIGAAIACFLAPPLLAGPAFASPALIWLGLSPAFPRTNDFVPLFPWFGAVLAGIAAARLWPILAPRAAALSRITVPWQFLWAGRHSLAIYLLHQPVLFGLVYLAATLAPPAPVAFQPWFSNACNTQCIESEVDSDVCQRICSCLAPRAEAEGLSGPLVLGHMTDEENERYSALVRQCEVASDPQ